MLLAGRSEGLVLDPVYTGKALAGALAQVREGAWRGARPLVFVHSGGAPGLFASARELAPWLSA
jgi:1-aminocyclopropane-1-carboxylate deaminase/D-cysteine desulfhydrase-like pyridoxal-dependent ACC family enzyme